MRTVCRGALLLALSVPLSATGEPPLSLRGSSTQGGLLVGRTAPGAVVTLDDQTVRVSAEGAFLIGFGRDAPGQARLVVRAPGAAVLERDLRVEPRRYRVQRIDGLPPSRVTPPAAVLERIGTEAELVREARRRDDARTDFLGGFGWPVVGPVSGVYGSQRILNGEPRQPHYGVDVAVPVGTPVVAPADGIVTLVHPDMYYSGGTLILDHGHGLSSSFLHLSRIRVPVGRRVARGEVIAEVGATGRVTGAHLDWRMNLLGVRIDPALLVEPMPGG